MKSLLFVLLLACICLPENVPAAEQPVPAKSKSNSNSKAKNARKAAPNSVVTINRPMRPPAGFVPRVEAALQHGCVHEQEVQAAALRLGIPRSDIENILPGLHPSPGSSEPVCINYAEAVLPAGIGSSLAVLEPRSEKTAIAVTVVRSNSNGSIDSTRQTLSMAGWRELIVPAVEIRGGNSDGILSLPDHLQWEANILLRRLVVDVESLPRHQVRIVLHTPGGESFDKIAAIELIDTASERVVDSVVWLDRDDDIGAYFNPRGDNFERLFWESPVEFTRITRGVGKGAVTIKRRVAVKSSGKKKKSFVSRTIRYRGLHVGIDFAVPVGTPVRAVADAVVVFVGPRGGYGNLIVLEHGKNYQTYYAHLSRFADELTVGQKIFRGEEIGYVGMTGITTGPHLHFEIRKDNQYFDPLASQNNMTLWNLYPEEHAQLLAKFVALNVTRATRQLPPAIRSAQSR